VLNALQISIDQLGVDVLKVRPTTPRYMDIEEQNNLTIEAVYVDGSMVELETSFRSCHWSARATAYTQFADVADFAARLARFSKTLRGEESFVAGREDSPTGFLGLRFYPIGRTGHFVCHLRLGTNEATEHRPEEIWRCSVELAADAAALDTFINGLQCIANTQRGRAVMMLSMYVAH
jgi:hypothetical protein